LTNETFTGVWFSDQPLDINEGAKEDCVLLIEIPEGVFAECEWVEEGKPYRESLIPAAIVNRYGPPKIYDHDWAGISRQRSLEIAERRPAAAEIRRAIGFFDRFGYIDAAHDADIPAVQSHAAD
jgi:hypothetical protein